MRCADSRSAARPARRRCKGLVNRDLAGKVGELASAHPGSAPPL
jgi:hypothetical protein